VAERFKAPVLKFDGDHISVIFDVKKSLLQLLTSKLRSV